LSKQEYLARLAKSLANLQRREAEGGDFVSCIVSIGAPLRSGGDVGAVDVGGGGQSTSPLERKQRTCVSARDWDILADFMPHGGTRTAFSYQAELQAVKDTIRR